MNFNDFSSPEFFEDPYPLYEKLRLAGAIVPIGRNAVVTGRLSVIESLLRNRSMGKAYMQSVVARYGSGASLQPLFKTLSRTFLMMNPPAHTRLRALLMKAFNARQMDKLRKIVETTANALADGLSRKQEFDLVSEFALPLPVEIICRLLEIPPAEGCDLGAAASCLVAAMDISPLNDQMLVEANDAALSLEAYFGPVVGERRLNRGDDLISSLLVVEDEGVSLTEEEIISNVILLFVAGHETTSNMIGNALIALHRHPLELEKLRRDPTLMSKAVAECMRYDSSVQMVARTALEEVIVSDVTLAPGTVVFMSIGAACRDHEAFSDPDRIDFNRPENGRFLAFGSVIHYCLGARLASMEIEIALKTLLDRFPDLQLVELEDLKWHTRNSLRGVQWLLARHCME
jgi:cytochrome P450